MIRYPTQSNYPDTEPTSACPILILLSAWLGLTSISFKVIGLTRPVFKPMRSESPDLPKHETGALLIRPSSLVTPLSAGHSWILLSNLFFSPTLLPPLTVPCRMVFAKPEDDYVLSVCASVNRSSYGPMTYLKSSCKRLNKLHLTI